MISKGYHRYAVGALVYDAEDIAERQKTQRVVELAASRKKFAIHPITVETGGLLLAGRDRLAADLLNGASTVDAHVVEGCTEADRLEIEVEENVRRRDIDRNQQLARLVQLKADEIERTPPAKSGKRGRPQTAKGAARVEVAKVAKTTPEAVRRAEQRAAEKEAPPAVEPPLIRDFGLGLPAAFTVAQSPLRTEIEACDVAAAKLSAALGLLGQARDALRLGKWQSDASRLYDQVHKLNSDVRASRPAALCFYCKGRGSVAEKTVCAFCRGVRWITVAQAAMDVPAELLLEGDEAMVSDGRGGFAKFSKGAPSDAERFWTSVSKGAGDACWTWAGEMRGGYGRFFAAGRRHSAHVYSFEMENGPIPDGLELDHVCKNTACVRPDHLEPVTHKENVLRSDGPAAKNARKTHCLRGHEFTPENTYVYKVRNGQGRQCRQCVRDLDAAKKAVASPPPPRSSKSRRMPVDMGDGTIVDALNPDEVEAYSGQDAPPADLPELVVEPDEAVEWADDDGEAA